MIRIGFGGLLKYNPGSDTRPGQAQLICLEGLRLSFLRLQGLLWRTEGNPGPIPASFALEVWILIFLAHLLQA